MGNTSSNGGFSIAMLDYWRVPQIRKKRISRYFLGRIHFSGGTKLLSSLHRCLWNIVHLANMFAIVPCVTPPQSKVNVSVYMLVAVGCTWGSVVANIPSKIASINAPYNVSGNYTMSTPPRYDRDLQSWTLEGFRWNDRIFPMLHQVLWLDGRTAVSKSKTSAKLDLDLLSEIFMKYKKHKM